MDIGRLFVWLVSYCYACHITAQTTISFTSDQGLSNTCIHSIMQDSRQNVWICTQNGLNRYDGVKMNVYHHDEKMPGSLGHDDTNCVLEMKSGKILVGMESGVQLYCYDTDSFTDVPLVAAGGAVLPAHVVSMSKMSDGTVYVCTAGYGLYRLSPDSEELAFHEVKDIPLKNMVIHIMEDSRKNVWILETDGNVSLLKDKTLKTIGCFPDAIRFCESSSGNVYLSTVRSGLYNYDEQAGRFVRVNSASRDYVVAAVSRGAANQLLISTDGNGLLIYDEITGETHQSNIRTHEYNLLSSNVKDAMVDADGNIWVGVYWKGVLVMPNIASSFDYIGRRSVNKNTIGTNCVTAITGDGKGDMWVATDHCGIYRVAHDGTSSIHYKPGEVPGIPSTIMSIHEDSEGTIWLGASYSGVVLMDGDTGHCTDLGKVVKGGEQIPNAYAITEDGYKNIWIATMGNGLFCYNLNTRELSHYTAKKNNSQVYPYHILNNTYIRSLLIHRDFLYAGTADGLDMFQLTKTGLKPVRRMLYKTTVRDMKMDAAGNIWVATTKGLGCMDTDGNDLKMLTTENGLANDFVNSIEIVPDGKVWASTDNGISCYNPVTKTFENYRIIDGLQGNEFSCRASLFQNGLVYFGGINGISYFRPTDIGKKEEIAKVRLRLIDFYVDGKPVHGGDRSGRYTIIDKWFPLVDEVNLSHNDKSFGIELSAMSFNNRRVAYYYAVDNGDWIALEEGQNRISFIDMEPGKHRIRMKAESYGNESEVKELRVVIHPAWYLSPLAKVIYCVLLLFALYLLSVQLKERYKARQILAKHRQTEELNEARIQFFMNISHEIRTPMTLILSPLMKLMKMDKDEEHQRNYSLIYQNSQRILRLINQLMDARKIEKGQFRLKYHKVELVGFINNLYELFATTAANRKIAFNFQHAMERLEVCIDPQNFDKVVMNLLSNAFKFTPDGGEITIELQDVEGKHPADHDFVLMVTDNGAGVPDNAKQRIFERFYSGKWGDGYVGTGIGLNLTKLLVELHEGKIWVEDNPAGKGCRFIVRMPQMLQMLQGIVDDSLPEAHTLPELHHQAERTVEVYEAPSDDKGARKHFNVMIVEDEAAIRRYLRNELSSRYQVTEFANGKDAWEAIIKDPEAFDMVLSDVMMPEMDGITLCHEIKGNFNTSHIPVVLLSAKSDDEDKMVGLSKGADAYMTKPFNIDLLKQTVNNLLESHHRIQGKYGVVAKQEEKIDKIELTSPDEKLMERMMKVINDNMSNPDLNVEFIADKIGISRVHLHRRMKGMTSLTPRDFVRNIRLSQAAKLLSEKHLDITDVSIATGFRSVSTFSTCFKAYYGMTPSEYMKRKSKNKGDETPSADGKNKKK